VKLQYFYKSDVFAIEDGKMDPIEFRVFVRAKPWLYSIPENVLETKEKAECHSN